MLAQTEHELAQDSVNAVGQIFSNYQAALHLLEEAVTSGYGEAVPHAPALDLLHHAAADVFTPVLDACAGVAPGLEELVAETIGTVADPGKGDAVVAERQRVAATHSRLIRRRPALLKAAESRAAIDRRALVAAAHRLDELATGSHSAGALFQLLFARWPRTKVLSGD
jgi:hypothetical protein